MKTPFPTSPHLTAIAIAYKNPDAALIADEVLPRVPVAAIDFQYTSFANPSMYRIPNMKVGPRSRVNRLELSGQRLPGSVEDNALEVPLSWYEVNPSSLGTIAGNVPKPEEVATAAVINYVTLSHELDVASLVFDAATYPADQQETLVGTDQFSDYVNSDPIGVVHAGLDAALVRPNVLVFGQPLWSVFRMHPHIVAATNKNSGDHGAAAREAVAELFEVQKVLVGSAFVDSSKPGETPTMTRAWGKHLAGIYRDAMAAQSGGLTFGATFQFGTRVAGAYDDQSIGLRGGRVVKAGESTKPMVCAPAAAYFWQNAAA